MQNHDQKQRDIGDHNSRFQENCRENKQTAGQRGIVDIQWCHCHDFGHHQGQCTNPPYCYNCRNKGHKAALCPMKKNLVLCGFGILVGGFYSIRIPDDNKTGREKVPWDYDH